MLVLYSQCPSDWLKEIIESSVDHAHKSYWMKSFTERDHRAAVYVNILLLCILHFQKQYYLELLIEYLQLLHKQNDTLSADVFTHWAFGSRDVGFEVNPNDPFHFSLSTHGQHLGVIVNPSGHARKYEVTFPQPERFDCEIKFHKGILSDNNSVYELESKGYILFHFDPSPSEGQSEESE